MTSILTNMAATLAVNNLNSASSQASSVLEAMSSGKKINSASDDASGLAVYTTMSTDEAAWNQAADNADVAQAILETADGGLSETTDVLNRMYEIASQASSGSVTDTQRAYLDDEFSQLVTQLDSIVGSTSYSGQSLLDGSYNSSFLVSANASDANSTIDVTIGQAYDSTGLALGSSTVATSTDASTALTAISAAIDTVSAGRANVGAMMSRFDYASGVISTSTENLQSAMSVYMDADVADLSAQQTQLGVKMDSAIQALSVANTNIEKISRLLR
ncbi:flagellin [Tistlia consotensis]|uniref:Flagellin n=1 Tax=Tistlia consotensis USBA 355 TaxID=560819 RepID=A0A1Y6B7B2_9PROT|nr:flagellin [Tistlia consotensis]SME96829.1 flagellin [Tistlia consotensis USBA 355]SNR56201.1 flagellin [Tistlia consotensis]